MLRVREWGCYVVASTMLGWFLLIGRRLRRLMVRFSCLWMCWAVVAVWGRYQMFWLRLAGTDGSATCGLWPDPTVGGAVVVRGPPLGGARCVGAWPPHRAACCVGAWPPA